MGDTNKGHSMALRSREQRTRQDSKPADNESDSQVNDESEPQMEDDSESQAKRYLKLYLQQPLYHLWEVSSGRCEAPIWWFFVVSLIVLQVVFSVFLICKSDTCQKITLANLQEAYPPKDSDLWKGVKTVLRVCNKSSQPSVLLILHNSTNSSDTNCLAENIATALSYSISAVGKCGTYNVDSETVSQEFSDKNFLEYVLSKRDSEGVVVLTQLEALPSKFAKDLHFICERDQHRANKFIIILVLQVEGNVSVQPRDLSVLATKKLRDLWGADLKDRMDPILGRITNIVVSVGDIPDQTKQQLVCN